MRRRRDEQVEWQLTAAFRGGQDERMPCGTQKPAARGHAWWPASRQEEGTSPSVNFSNNNNNVNFSVRVIFSREIRCGRMWLRRVCPPPRRADHVGSPFTWRYKNGLRETLCDICELRSFHRDELI